MADLLRAKVGQRKEGKDNYFPSSCEIGVLSERKEGERGGILGEGRGMRILD